MAVLSLLIFRLLWGLFGSSTARFASFVRGPRAVLDYLRGKWTRDRPFAAWCAQRRCTARRSSRSQAGLGLFSSDEDGLMSGPLANVISLDLSEEITDLHEDLFNVLLVLIGIHVAAVHLLLDRQAAEPGRADGHRQGRAGSRHRADAAGQMVGRAALPGRRNRDHALADRRRAAVRGLIARSRGTTSHSMLIHTEQTPNPSTRKFLPGQRVMDAGTRDFPDWESAEASPLASALFATGKVEGVFFGGDFISVTAAPTVEWTALEPEVVGILLDHFVSGAPLFAPGTAAGIHIDDEADFEDDPADAEIIAQIRELIDTRVRPAVAQDGGDIVYKRLQGWAALPRHAGRLLGLPVVRRSR